MVSHPNFTNTEAKQWIDFWFLFTIAYLTWAIIQPYGAKARLPRYIKLNAKWILKITEKLLLFQP